MPAKPLKRKPATSQITEEQALDFAQLTLDIFKHKKQLDKHSQDKTNAIRKAK